MFKIAETLVAAPTPGASDELAPPIALDSAVMVQLLGDGDVQPALDALARALRVRFGQQSRVIISLADPQDATKVFSSADGRGQASSYLSGIDFPEAADDTGLRRVRIDVTGVNPLAAVGKGEALLRAIASGFKEAVCVEIKLDDAPVGMIAVFAAEALKDGELASRHLAEAASVGTLIAALRRTVQRANAGDKRFAALSSTLPGVIYQRVVSPSGEIRYVYISENAYDLFGVTAEKILTDPEALFAHYGEDYRRDFRQKLLEASKTMSIWDVEATIKRPDGDVRYTHAIARPSREPDGSVMWTGVILDSTRIKKAEMAAAAAEVRTRQALVESLSQGVLMFGPDDKLTLRNTHFLSLYPRLQDKVDIGAHYEDVLRFELMGAASDIAESNAVEEFNERVARHGEPHLVFEREMAGDRHILVNEYRTPENETVVLYTDISELKRRERKIEHLAHHDALTGLPNRVLFHERLNTALARSGHGQRVAVICLDLDRFKSVNDTLGHHVGDILLQEVAIRIRETLGDKEMPCRLGGDEFAIICPDVKDPGEATSLAWRLLNSLSQPHVIQDQTVMGGTSIGIAISGQDGDNAEALLKNADLALYRAKTDGRGTFRFFEQEMDLKAQARRMMELALRSAIAREELEVHYQPLVDAHTSQVIGAEALLRWNVPGQGYISPSQFVPLAEETGLISELGRWVLQRACTDATGWDGEVRVAVNLSPAQLRNANFVDSVKEILQKTGLAPQRLELEITEGMLLQNTESNTKMLIELKQLGIRISMDDFGTGYSSLGSLRAFPFDKIKIDKSFIADLAKRPDAAAITRAILTLGRSLGMTTTAEGVETRDQLAYLRAEGCVEVQGFYFAAALKESNFRDVLLEQAQNGAAAGKSGSLANARLGA
jgi:diguanylate cyclase (GGDEF)-like protein